MESAREEDWLTGARAGEAWALEQLYQAHHASIYALCHRMLGRPEDAEDAVQGTFVHAFRALPRFHGRSTVKTWLYHIAVNQSIDMLRRREKAPLPLEMDVPLEEHGPSMADKLAIRGTLAHLRPEHRAVLVLRFWEELSYQEMADVLGVPLPTVKMRLNRAKSEFTKRYEDGAL